MNRSIRRNLVRTLFLTFGIAGCNAILDNKPGQLGETPTEVAPTQPTTTEPATNEGGEQDGGVSPPDPHCPAGQWTCNGSCVRATDPVFGCGDPGCTPCKTAHGTPSCEGNKCVVHACDPGYADCNGDPADGCEVDLSRAATCGSCNAACPVATPVCAPSGTTFQCTTGCAPAAPLLCGAQCVAPASNVNHCGGCDVVCPAVEQAVVECAASQCTFSCRPGYHACGGKCAVTTDPAACGPACAVCPIPLNAVPTCTTDACGFECKVGFGNCNAAPADGCESALTTDPLNCGICGKSCGAGGTCTNGVCSPVLDGG